MLHQKKWFTLVELIVVITILAILSTIASMYLFNNFADSRDSARMTDINLISTNLELYFTQESKYPMADDPISVMHEWAVAWQQWVFWENVTKRIKNFWQDIPSDPKYSNYYSYSTTNYDREYQVASILEWLNEEENLGEEISLKWFTEQSYASIETAYVKGDYNSLMVRARSGSIDYYIATPSIISRDLSLTGAVDIIRDRKLVYDKFFNLPASYSGFIDTAWGFDFNVSDPIIFSGSMESLQTDTSISLFSEKLKYIYATTPTESFDVYRSVLDSDTHTKVKTFLSKNFQVQFKYPFDCRDILDSWSSHGDGTYMVDVDWNGPEPVHEVYCDMTTGGWWWTRKGISHITNGFFQSGSGITSAISYPNAWANVVVALDNPAYSWSWYALHQTGTNDSYYEVKIDDLSQLSIWDEIRMTLWVADEDDDSWSNILGINPHAFYMFHNRVYYTDGTFSTNGKVRLLDTKTVAWKTWKLLQVRQEIKKEIQDFSWFIGWDAENTKDLYIAWVDVEVYFGWYSLSEDSLYDARILQWGWGTLPDSWPQVPEWWDLRSGGKTLTDGNGAWNDIRYKNGMNMTRDASWISFFGVGNWRSWVKFESAAWNRWDDKTIEWIFKEPTSDRMMLGIGSINTRENRNGQYREAEVLSYILTSWGWRLWGLYGNKWIIWRMGRHKKITGFSSCASDVIKTVINHDGTIGTSELSVYCLPSANKADWDDTSNEIITFTIAWSLDPDEDILLPFISPRNAGAKYIALRVK